MAMQWFQRAGFVGSGGAGASTATAAMVGDGVQAEAAFDGVERAQLFAHLNAADILAYENRAQPSNGASVDYLKARSLLFGDAVQFGSSNMPTFGQDAGGTGRHGLRFTDASNQVLSWPGLATRINQNNMAVTMWAVFRFAATLSGTQTIMGASVDGAFADYRQTVRLKCGAAGFYFNAQTGTGTDTLSAAVASAPAADTTYIAVGRHDTPSGANVNVLDVRIGGSTSNNANATAQDIDFGSTGAMNQAFVGAHRRGGTLKEFLNGWFLAGGCYDRYLSDTEVTALITVLREDWGVA